MSLSVMSTKLQKPQLPMSVVEKEEMNHRLSVAKINIICAQAGSGKSTVVSRWLEFQESPYIWYALDEWDNDLAQFLTYLAQGIFAIDTEVSNQMKQLLTARQTIGDDALIKSFTTLLNAVQIPFIWVLDDYHMIQEDNIHQMMKTLLSHFPQNMQLCIISREDPPFSLAKLRAQRQLTELRMSDLRFTLKETESFLASNIEQTLTSSQMAYLYGRTEGWIAGLQLTAQSLQGVDDVDRFIQNFSESHYYIMDYLLEEVLERHTVAMRQFLLKSSIFEYFSPELCDFVFDYSPGESQKVIDYLIKTNSFLIELNQKVWFRYHHLFRELLRGRIEILDKNHINRLHMSAGMWFEKHGGIQEAIDHYLNGGHHDLAASLIELRWSTMDMELSSSSWHDMARRLPQKWIDNSPVLSTGIGWALLDRGDVENCIPYFDHAQNLYDQWQQSGESSGVFIYDWVELRQLPVTLMNAKAYIAAVQGDYKGLLEITEALKLLANQHTYKKQWVIETYIATLHWGKGELDQAIEHMLMMKNDSLGELNPLIQNSMVWVLAELYIQKGELNDAKSILETAIDQVEREGIVPILLATYYLYLAMIEAYRGNATLAFEYLETSNSFGHRFEFMYWRYNYFTLKARLCIQEGLWSLAKESIKMGKNSEYRNPIPDSFNIEDMDLYLSLKQAKDDLSLKQHIDKALKTLKPFSEEETPYTEEMKWKLIIRFAPIQVYGAMLEPICTSLTHRAKTQKRWLHEIEFTLLLMRFTKSEAKRLSLRQYAETLAKKEGLVLPFIEFSDWSTEQSKILVNQTLEVPLTSREFEILTLIEGGFSNQEIANKLFIALSTVKSYNNSLFGKLEVKRRTEAIAKAKTLGLL